MNMIFAVLFLISSLFASPYLSTASQDTEIKNNVAIMAAVVQEFISNNNGRIPSDADFEKLVADGSYKDPLTGHPYGADNYFPGERCDGTHQARATSVKVKLTDGSEYCVD